jgi:HEAT repeat protein
VALECIRDSDVDVRRAAALALGRLGVRRPEASVGALRTVLESDGDVAARAFALLALGEVGGPEAKREVLQRLARGKQLLRPWAALGAGLLARPTSDPEVGRVLARSLEEENNRDTRAAIALAIGLSRTAEGREGVRRLVAEGENTRERVYASLAVALGADRGGCEALRRAMREIPNPLVRAASALALSAFREPADATALLAVYESCEDPDALAPAALALAWNGSRQAQEKLRHDVGSSPRADRRAAAVIALGLGLAPERVPSSVAATARWNFLASQEAAHLAARLWM